MANPLFKMLGNSNFTGNNNMVNMIRQFNEFKRTFQGNPKQKVQELLNTGKMSQSQFNQLQEMAKQFTDMIK